MVANQACFSGNPLSTLRSNCRSMGTCVKSQSWLIRSKQALMSFENPLWTVRWLNKVWVCASASAQRRSSESRRNGRQLEIPRWIETSK